MLTRVARAIGADIISAKIAKGVVHLLLLIVHLLLEPFFPMEPHICYPFPLVRAGGDLLVLCCLLKKLPLFIICLLLTSMVELAKTEGHCACQNSDLIELWCPRRSCWRPTVTATHYVCHCWRLPALSPSISVLLMCDNQLPVIGFKSL